MIVIVCLWEDRQIAIFLLLCVSVVHTFTWNNCKIELIKNWVMKYERERERWSWIGLFLAPTNTFCCMVWKCECDMVCPKKNNNEMNTNTRHFCDITKYLTCNTYHSFIQNITRQCIELPSASTNRSIKYFESIWRETSTFFVVVMPSKSADSVSSPIVRRRLPCTHDYYTVCWYCRNILSLGFDYMWIWKSTKNEEIRTRKIRILCLFIIYLFASICWKGFCRSW